MKKLKNSRNYRLVKTTALALFVATIMLLGSVSAVDMAVDTTNNNVIYDDKEVTTPSNSEFRAKDDSTNRLADFASVDNGEKPSSIGRAIFEEGFEGGVMPPTGWLLDELNLVSPWGLVDAATHPDWVHSGEYAAWINYDTPNPSDNWLITPDIDLTGYTDGVEFQFWIVTDTNWVAYATLEVYINNGTGNTLLWNLNEETWPDFIYYQKTFNLDAYVDQVVNISFRYVGQDGNSLGLDDIILYEPTDDVGVVSIESPISGTATGALTPEVTVKNYGPSDLEDVPVQMQIGDVVAAPGGVFYDFEADNGSFIGTGIWDWGTPTSGPMGAYSGTNLWATNLVGNYIAGLHTLTTSAILLPAQAELSFWHWYYIETSWDGGNVKISTDNGVTWTVITPDDGYTGTANSANPLYPEPIFTGTAHQSWEQQIFDLSTYAGQTVMFRFDFGADGSVFYSGWYIDDVLIGTKQMVPEYDQTMLVDIDAGETVTVTFPDWMPAAWQTVENADISYDIWAQTHLVTDTNPANDFLDDQALLHFGFYHDIATTVLQPESGPAQTLPVEVEITNIGQYPEAYFDVDASIAKEFLPVTIFSEGFEGFVPQVDVFPPTGWTLISTSASTWFKYLPTSTMRARVSEDNTGAQDEWLITNTMDFTGAPLVMMSYYRYMATPNDDYCQVLGSIDDGATWTVEIANYSAYASAATETFDITSWAAGQSQVKVAFHWVSTESLTGSDYFYFDDLSFGVDWGPFGDNPPLGWTILDYGDEATPTWNNNDWHKYTHSTYGPMARVYYSPSPYEHMDEWLISPTIDCSALTTVDLDVFMYFYFYATYAGYGIIEGSTDGGATWSHSIDNLSATLSYNTYTWDITSWAAGQSNVKIRFRYWTPPTASYSRYWYIGNVDVSDGTTNVFSEDFTPPIVYYSETFDEIIPESGFPPAGWGQTDIINMDSTIPPDPNIWRAAGDDYLTNPSVDPYTGDYMTIYDTGLLYPQGSEARLYTPAIPIYSPGAGIYRLAFMMHLNNYGSTYDSHLVVEYSGDGVTWYDMETITRYDPANPGWVLQEIDVTAFAGYYVYFGFRGVDDGYDDLMLDDITVKAYGVGSEYAESQLISDYIFPGETVTLSFPDWTPNDLALLVSGSVDYTVEGSHDLVDGNATNDLDTRSITLDYIHDVTVKDITEPSMGRNDDVFYAFNSYPGDDSVWFDPSTPGVLNVIGPNTAPDFICSGTWADGTWYVGCYLGGIYTVDPNVGTMTLIGGTTAWNGMAYDGSTMYGATSTQLYEIDVSTGAATLIGSFGIGGELMIDIAIDQDTGICYGHDIVTDSIYTIDLSTGAATLLGSTGLSCNYAQGMEYDQDNGILYLSAYTAQGELYTCDTATGACTLVGAFQGGAEVCGLAIPYSGGGPGPGNADVYVAPGSQSFAAITENLGTFPELGLTAHAELNAFNETGVPYLIYEENYSDFDLDVGEEETATFGSYTFVDSEIYNLVIFLPLGVDDEPANNIKELAIAVDGVAPTSDHSIDPTAPNGENGWYISEVTVTLSADDGSEGWQSGVDDIKYKIDGGSEMTYTDPFVVSTDGEHTVTYWAVDNVGNKEADNTVDFDIDTTGPTVDLTWEAGTEKNQIIFTATCSDGLSGMDKVEFLYNDVVQSTSDTAPYTWTMVHGPGNKYTVKAIAYDAAGNSDFDEIGSGEGLHQYTPTNPTVQTTTPLIK